MHRLTRTPSWLVAVVATAALLAWEFTSLEGHPVNPDALATVQAIVTMCEGDGAPDDAAPCESVRHLMRWCRTKGKGTCVVDNVYESLLTMGFQLPPLRSQAPPLAPAP